MTQDSGNRLQISVKTPIKPRFFLFFSFLLLFSTRAGAQLGGFLRGPAESPKWLLIQTARTYLGVPYLAGGTSRDGLDCSGFVHLAAEALSLELPRTAAGISSGAETIPDEALEPGDLLFFGIDGHITHVGIYLGGSTFIHSASRGLRTGVIISELSETYWRRTYSHAGRILRQEGLKIPAGEGEQAPSINPFPITGRFGFRIDLGGEPPGI
jgi:Cell wall-associated hydrolases (invasion-associated proteins)